MSNESIQVDLRHVNYGGVKAYGDVTLPTPVGEVTIKGFRVISKNGEPPWVGFPSTSYQKEGKSVNKPLLELRTGVRRQIAEAILRAFDGNAGSDKR